MLLIPTRLCIMVCVHMVAYYYNKKRVTVPEITEHIKVNPRTLNPALTRLVRAGILNSKTGGSDRGYILARDPKEISIYDITHTIQGDTTMRCCDDVTENTTCIVKKGGNCLIYSRLNKVLLKIKEELENISLYDQYNELRKFNCDS
ncbi:MAG: Rrf2 family transcriptional regulator [Rikenellaceae bacterium]